MMVNGTTRVSTRVDWFGEGVKSSRPMTLRRIVWVGGVRDVVTFCCTRALQNQWRTASPGQIHKLPRGLAVRPQTSSLMEGLLGVLKGAVGVLKGSIDTVKRVRVTGDRARESCLSA